MTLTAKSSLTSPVDDVLQDYLNDLLVTATELSVASVPEQPVMVETALVSVQQTVTASVAVKPVALREPMPNILPADIPVATEPVSPAVTMPETVATGSPSSLLEPAVAEPEIAALTETELDAMASEQARLNWQASAGVECLIFKVAGLKLALPLPMLGGVFNANDDVTPLFGQAKWSLGVWQSETDTLTIVDSAQLIMPERGALLADQGYRYIIQLDRSPWALACQEICDTMTLKHDSIKWRGEGSKRPWLAGTVISEMCALIDVSGMLRMLEQHRRVKR